MARYIYEWKPTEHGRRLFRRPNPRAAATRSPAPEPEPETETVNFGALKKDALIALADERGVDSTGTKADIIARLDDDGD